VVIKLHHEGRLFREPCIIYWLRTELRRGHRLDVQYRHTFATKKAVSRWYYLDLRKIKTHLNIKIFNIKMINEVARIALPTLVFIAFVNMTKK
jgi:hypothetical protein